jgi:hypothetical protein
MWGCMLSSHLLCTHAQMIGPLGCQIQVGNSQDQVRSLTVCHTHSTARLKAHKTKSQADKPWTSAHEEQHKCAKAAQQPVLYRKHAAIPSSSCHTLHAIWQTLSLMHCAPHTQCALLSWSVQEPTGK